MYFDVYTTAIEELSLSGAVALPGLAPSSVSHYVWVINQRLKRIKANWRVASKPKDRVIYVRPLKESERNDDE